MYAILLINVALPMINKLQYNTTLCRFQVIFTMLVVCTFSTKSINRLVIELDSINTFSPFLLEEIVCASYYIKYNGILYTHLEIYENYLSPWRHRSYYVMMRAIVVVILCFFISVVHSWMHHFMWRFINIFSSFLHRVLAK